MLGCIPHDEHPRLMLKRIVLHLSIVLPNRVKMTDVNRQKMTSTYSIWVLNMGDAADRGRGDWRDGVKGAISL